MSERGHYIGRDLGRVKKRHLRGLSEMIEARDEEMVSATSEYRQWQEMSPDRHAEQLVVVRMPVDVSRGRWNSGEVYPAETGRRPTSSNERRSCGRRPRGRSPVVGSLVLSPLLSLRTSIITQATLSMPQLGQTALALRSPGHSDRPTLLACIMHCA